MESVNLIESFSLFKEDQKHRSRNVNEHHRRCIS
jgi:hypothetical protein